MDPRTAFDSDSLAEKNIALRQAHDRITQLEAALEPFASFADPNRRIPANFVVTNGSSLARRQITMGDCYAAAQARGGKCDE